ncbi:hypothetical protein RJT34_02878 [Clitoria ternatea]|uniref:Uncharacterized protein n=1 Tax=Clitoria ternatea TaxID=43366 RepID=A0AAN9KJ79_CLITE
MDLQESSESLDLTAAMHRGRVLLLLTEMKIQVQPSPKDHPETKEELWLIIMLPHPPHLIVSRLEMITLEVLHFVVCKNFCSDNIL